MNSLYRHGLMREVAVCAACLALAMVVTIVIGHDANWDLRNYHLYNAYAFYEGRYHLDLMPVGVQSYLNPLMDIPYFIIATRFGLQAASIYLALYYGALVYVAWKINQYVFSELHLIHGGSMLSCRIIYPLTATLLGISASATLSQSATTFNEIQLALLILAGVLILLAELKAAQGRPYGAALAGVLFGAAAGLKLTAAIYTPAVLIALAFASPNFRFVRLCIAFGIGWAAGALLTFGWWGWQVYELFDNPIFPFYNGVFRSSWYPPVNFSDNRFFPENAVEWLLYPLNWAFHPSHDVTEPPMQDPRLAAFLFSLPIIAIFFSRLLVISNRLRFLILFSLLSYAVWLVQFSVLRYAVSVEILAGTVVILLLAAVVSSYRRGGSVAAVVASVLILATMQLATTYPRWGRIDFPEKAYYFEFPAIPPQTLVLMNGQPTGIVIPFIRQEGVAFLGALPQTAVADGFGLVEEMRRRVAEHRGPLRVIIRGTPDAASLSILGVEAQTGTCQSVRTNIENDTDIMICDARRI